MTTNNLYSGIRFFLLLHVFILLFFTAFSQETSYEQVVRERSRKILNAISVSDSSIFNKTLDLLSAQYVQLNALHDKKSQDIAQLKKDTLLDKQSMQQQSLAIDSICKAGLRLLHQQFLTKLGKLLSPEQVDQVKDGMTYRVYPITVAAYQDMLPGLTAEQKTKIIEWLKEARELAMDEGSSNKKHEMFGKYKGRINNYLSAQGFDMKKESRDWEERIRQRKEQEKSNIHQ